MLLTVYSYSKKSVDFVECQQIKMKKDELLVIAVSSLMFRS